MKRSHGTTLRFTGKAAQEVFDALTRPEPTPLERTREVTANAMETISQQFKPGALVTVLVRMPGKPEQDFMLTNDLDFNEIIALVERRKKAAGQ